MIASWPRWFRVCQFDLISFNDSPYIRCQQWNIWWPLIISLVMVFAPWWFYAQGSLRLYNFNKPQRPIIFFCLFFSFRSFRNDVEYEVVILPSALLQNWSVWSKIVLHKNVDIIKAATKWQKQLLLPSHWLSKTLPKALRTQALTALTSNFGSVGLVRWVWLGRFGLVG